MSGRKCGCVLYGPSGHSGGQCISASQTPKSLEFFNPFVLRVVTFYLNSEMEGDKKFSKHVHRVN